MSLLPEPFQRWFSRRWWRPRSHQLALMERAAEGGSTLLIAPTGAGKTLAGFLPSLVELSALPKLAERPHALHTLYVSPLKALAVDVARNVEGPAREMELGVRIESRTGDTPAARRQRQRAKPPDILLTTPEQVSLLIASEHARVFFQDLKTLIVDEVHALAPTKRGDLLALAMARIAGFAPGLRRIGLSATVADPPALASWLAPDAAIVQGPSGAGPDITVLDSRERIPWTGHTGRHALPEIYAAIKTARTALVFVNTRAQAELTFQLLWRLNTDGLPIALHHGSLDVEQRRKVEAAMARGALRAVVCTSTLDLGIDWGDVDLVIQMGAPKGCSRLVQRIGRANHRLDEPSRALLAPSNRFEVLECRAAQSAVAEGALDGGGPRRGGLDCLAQHLMGAACGEPFLAEDLYQEVSATTPYAGLSREQFDQALDFVATGGYALRVYDQFKRIVQRSDGRWTVRNRAIAQAHRMNVGAIVELTMLNVRLASKAGGGGPWRAGRSLGKIEEGFIEMLAPSDTFLFAGEVLKLEAVVGEDALVTRAASVKEPRIPSYAGGKFPLSTFLAERVRRMIAQPAAWANLPEQVVEWLQVQQERSLLPKPDELLVETFPRAGRWWLVCYPFDGRLAHQTLGMLLTRRLERARLRPQGFVASEYALGVWGLRDLSLLNMQELFAEDLLGDDLEEWLSESALMKRTFRNCAVIAGLVERRRPGLEKTGRQVSFSTDLIYDVLRSHEPGHLLLHAARADAGEGYLDLLRLSALLRRVRGRVAHIDLPRVSPFAAPVMLEVGRESVAGEAQDAVLEEAAEELIADAMRLDQV